MGFAYSKACKHGWQNNQGADVIRARIAKEPKSRGHTPYCAVFDIWEASVNRLDISMLKVHRVAPRACRISDQLAACSLKTPSQVE